MKPRKAYFTGTRILEKRLGALINLLPNDWSVYVTLTNTGRCSWQNKNITVPMWALDGPPPEDGYGPDKEYAIYYFCHECAHIPNEGKNHGPEFMEEFKRICPPHLWHYELDYKPRLARQAGIEKA